MPKKRKPASLDDKCRICLSDDGCMSDIFSDHLKLKITDLGKSASIPIEDDEVFPRNICHVCLYKLEMWVDFKEQFVRSDAMLREHLELGDLSDNKASLAKRKHSELQACTNDDSIQQGNAKKLKSNSPTPADQADTDLKTEKQSEQQEVTVESQKATEDSDVESDVTPVGAEMMMKIKQIAGRRTKTTERRKESTRRWVARKKALLAATGENDTDTDSMVSDDEQLSPVQKARAKCNAEKVAAESHRRMTRAMQNLDSNISGYYGTNNPDSESYVIPDSDTEVRKDRANCTIKTETPTDVGGGDDARLPSNNVSNVSSHPINSIAENAKNATNVADSFVPHSVRSELMIDGVTFVVTSTLVLSEPHYLNAAQANNSSMLATSDEAIQERNTDIIDAVQLRRVSPKNALSRSENKLIDTCLNIEVEGTEPDSLQRVQSELARFVEKGLKTKLVDDAENDDDDDAAQREKLDERVKDPAFQTLNQQLKMIVEKTIKKNLENTKQIDNRGNNTFTGEFLKAAVRSKIFQPRVHLVRYDPSCANPLGQKPRKSRKPNVLQDVAKSAPKLSSKKIEEPAAPPPPLGKRRSVQPAKYADYNTSPFDSESEEIAATSQVPKKPSTGPKSSKLKTYGPAAPKVVQTPVAANQHKIQQQSLLLPQKPVLVEKPAANNSASEKHICGVCGDSFSTRKEVETHFGTHKKQKMMRCKRCHEIVDARFVKSHVCSASKNLHKCTRCAASFRTEQLLARHAESHELEREARIEKASGVEPAPSVHETNVAAAAVAADFPKIASLNEKNDSQPAAENRESYTCFVCDKTFTDEELLKDHLQKHCDDMSEDERSNAKEYQCAICGESLDSEDALETHVEKHLFDDEDDNPNLISIGGAADVDKSVKSGGEMPHSCGQCSENFDSEMLLMLHMQAHEEEVAIAEWERRGIDNSQIEQHVCVICDDLFATEDDLSEHLDIHNGNAHICILCDKPFLTLEELQSHVNTH